jgi:hypothetical protein
VSVPPQSLKFCSVPLSVLIKFNFKQAEYFTLTNSHYVFSEATCHIQGFRHISIPQAYEQTLLLQVYSYKLNELHLMQSSKQRTYCRPMLADTASVPPPPPNLLISLLHTLKISITSYMIFSRKFKHDDVSYSPHITCFNTVNAAFCTVLFKLNVRMSSALSDV